MTKGGSLLEYPGADFQLSSEPGARSLEDFLLDIPFLLLPRGEDTCEFSKNLASHSPGSD